MLFPHDISVASLKEFVVLSLRIVAASAVATLFLRLTIKGFDSWIYPHQITEADSDTIFDATENAKYIGRAIVRDAKAHHNEWPKAVSLNLLKPYFKQELIVLKDPSLDGFTYERPSEKNLDKTKWWTEIGQVKTKFGVIRINAGGSAGF